MIIEKTEEYVYEVICMIRLLRATARNRGQPTDISCLNLDKTETASLHTLYESCKEFIEEYTQLTNTL